MPYDPSLLTPLPDIDQYIDDMAAKYRLDRNFFRANLYAESGENIDIGDSPKGAVGIGQVMPSTFEGIKKALPHLKSVRDPYDNVEASAYYLDQMLGIFDGDYDLAIAAYNAGPEAVKKYGGIPPFAETQKHVEKVRNKALGMASKSAAPQPPVQPVQPVSRVAREVATPWYRKPGYMITAPFTGVGEAIGNLMKGIAVENELAKKHYGPILEEALKYSPGGPTKAPPVEPPELNPLYKAGQYVAGTTGDVPTGVANSYTYQILKQLGYTGTQIALVLGARGLGRLIGPTEAANLGLLTAVGQPVLSEQAEMYERGRKQGASMDVALDAASEAAHLGLLDTLGVLGVLGTTKAILGHAGAKVLPETTSNVFRWVVNRVSTLSAKYPRTLSGVLSAIEEAMTEIPQGYLEDNIAIKHFNEVVDRYNNAKDAGIIAGGAGGIMGFILAALGIRLKSGKWRLDEKKGETEPDIKIPKPEERIILTEEMVEPTAPATPAEPAPQTVPPTQEVPATTPTTSGEPKAGGRWSEQLAVLDKLVDYAEDRLYKNAARKEYPTEARAKAAARMYSDLGLTVQPVKVGDKWKAALEEDIAALSQQDQAAAAEQSAMERAIRAGERVSREWEALDQAEQKAAEEAALRGSAYEAGVRARAKETARIEEIRRRIFAQKPEPTPAQPHQPATGAEPYVTAEPPKIESATGRPVPDVTSSRGAYGQNLTKEAKEAPKVIQRANGSQVAQKEIARQMVEGENQEQLAALQARAQRAKETGKTTPKGPVTDLSERRTIKDAEAKIAEIDQAIAKAPSKEGIARLEKARAALLKDLQKSRMSVVGSEPIVGAFPKIGELGNVFDNPEYRAYKKRIAEWEAKIAAEREESARARAARRAERQAQESGTQASREEEQVIPEVDQHIAEVVSNRPIEQSETSPFRQTPEETAQKTKLYENRDELRKALASADEEAYIAYRLHEANRWLDGDDSVDIGRIREDLLTRAASAGQHDVHRVLKNEAADWVQKLERPGTGSGVKLRSGIGPEDLSDIFNSVKFKQWFGKSKVVDEDGNPLTVYHGWKLVRPGGPEQTAESQLSGPHSVQALNTVEAAPAAAMPTEQQPVAGQSPAAQQTPAAKKRTTRVEKLLAANRQTLAMLEEKLGPLPVEGQPVVGEQPATAEQPVAEQPPAVSKKQAGPEPKYMKYVRALQEGATLERNAVLSTGEAVHPRQLVKMQEDGVIDFNPETQRFELTPGYRTEKSVEGVVAPDYEEFRKRLEEKQAAKSEPAPVPAQTVELVIEETKKSGKLSKADRRRAIAEAANRRKSRTESGGTTLYSFNPLHIPIFAKLIGKFMGDIKNTSGIDKIRPVARFAEDDATFLAKHWKQSWWYVKDKPELKAVLDTSLNRLTDSTNNLEESLKSVDAYRVLSKDKRRLVDRILVALDGMPYNEMGITEDHVLVEDRTLRLNDVFYRQYEDYIQQVVEANYKGEPTEIVKAITEIRRGLDKDRLMLLNTATRSQRYSDNMLNDIWAEAMIPNYFPHTRYGEMVVEGHILNEKGKWTKVYDTAIDMSLLLEFIPRGMSEKAFLKHAQNVLIPRLLKDPAIAELGIPEDGWVVKRRDNLQLHQYENHPMLIAMLNEVVERAVEHVEDPSLKFAIESVLPVAIRDAMKKGNWGHFAHRKNIPGYETRNVGKVLYDYKAGLYNLLAKAEAARRYGDLIKNIKGVNRRKWAVTFIGDDLSPMSKVDKAVATIRLLAYAKYMGMSLKNPIVNLSNMVNQGSPVLAMDVGPVADKYLVKAIKKIAARRHTPLDPMRERLLKELFTAGIIQSQYVKEVKSDLGTRPGYDRIADTVLRIVTLPMELTEVASRACTALAAYDAMVDGKIKNKKKLEELGIKKGQKFLQPTEAEYQKLKKFAETVVLDSHSLYGRASKPSFARTGVVGKTIAGAYIFTHFAQHVMHLYGYMMRQMIGGNMNAGYALVRSLAGTVAFGGAMAIPLAATLSAIYRKWFPKELRVVGDDPLQTLASKLPPGWDDVAQYGLPALGGITVGTSLALELPDALEDFFGVPVSMMKDIYTAKKAWSYGDGMRALEAIVPIKLLRDYLTARRLVNEGMTTVTGKPIGPGPGPAKLTNPLEIAGKIAGFQPVSMQKIRDIANMRMDLEEYVNAEKTRLSAMYVRALRNNDNQALEGVLDEWHEWNNFWLERHKTEYVISLREAIREKQRVERPPRRMRRMFMDIEKKRGLSNY